AVRRDATLGPLRAGPRGAHRRGAAGARSVLRRDPAAQAQRRRPLTMGNDRRDNSQVSSSRRFLRASALGAALTANAFRPRVGANPLAIPSFFGGWLTSELAPQNLAITAAGSAAYVARRRRHGGLTRDDRIAPAL